MESNSQPSEAFGTLPQDSVPFRTVPNHAEDFRTVPKVSERTENHILSVREVARMFENAGVPRTERSVTNWCRADASGVSRLDAYFDFNERRYFITPQSVERAIQEERAKARPENVPSNPESSGTFPNSQGERASYHEHTPRQEETERVKELERQIQDLKILNQGKDYFIELLQNDRKAVAEERGQFVEKLTTMSRQIGTLETQVRQLEAPRSERIIDTEPVTTPEREPIRVPVHTWETEQEAPQEPQGFNV